jgi:hypothetical protein
MRERLKGMAAPEERHVYRNKASSSIPTTLIRAGKAKKRESEGARERKGDLVLRRSEIAVDRGSLPLPALMIGDERMRERLKGMAAPEERHVYRNKASSSIPTTLIRAGKAKKGESPPASPTELFWRE